MKALPKSLLALFLITTMAITSAFASAVPPFKNGKVIMIITLEVHDFTQWKKAFDTGAAIREKAGIKVLSVCSSAGNENQIVVIEEAENAQAAHEFVTILKSRQKTGDMSKLDVKLYDKAE